MIKHVWSVLCKQSVIDSESNNISLLNVIEKVEGAVEVKGKKPKTLKMPVQMELITLWQRTSQGKFTFNCKTEIISPENKSLLSIDQDIEFPEDKQRMRNRVRMEFIPITSSGIYVYRTTTSIAEKKNSRFVVEIPLEVEISIKQTENS